MALIHTRSQECMVEELDLFTIKKTDVEYQPISTVTADTPIEFNIVGDENYVDLGFVNLLITARIKHKDGTNLETDEKNSPC